MTMMQRTIYLDNVCGMLIIHMIYTYHIAYSCSISDNIVIETINNLLFFFMAWFFFKGGMTFKKRDSRTMRTKSAKRLLIPYGIFCILGIVIDFVLKYFEDNFPGVIFFAKNEIHTFLTTSIVWSTGASWFLLSLFLVRISYNYLSDKFSNWLIAVLCLATSFLLTIANEGVPCYIGCFFHGMTLYSIGNCIKKAQFNQSVLFMSVCIFIPSFLMPSKIDFRDNSVMNGYFLVAIAYEIAGCIIVNNFFSRWMNKRNALLTYIGQNSMVFYLIHFPVMFVTVHCLSQYGDISNKGMIFLVTSLIVTISLIMADRIFKHDKMKFIVGG